MNREDALYNAKHLSKTYHNLCNDTEGFWEAVINALEQEPCDDVVSRQAVLDLMRSLKRWYVRSEDGKLNNVGLLYDDVMFGIDKLPPVRPKPETVTEFADRCRECGARYGRLLKAKMGHWIHTDECDEEWQYRCSKCNMPSRSNAHRYCSNCGSYMYGVEPQESEDKE